MQSEDLIGFSWYLSSSNGLLALWCLGLSHISALFTALAHVHRLGAICDIHHRGWKIDLAWPRQRGVVVGDTSGALSHLRHCIKGAHASRWSSIWCYFRRDFRFSLFTMHRNFSVHVHLTWAGIIEVLLSVENRLDFLNLVPGLKVVLGIDRVFSTAAIVLFRVVRKWAQRLLFLKAIF